MYNKTIDEIKQKFGVDKKGLTPEEAYERLKRDGKNKISEGKKVPGIVKFLRQFKNVLIMVLIGAMALSIVLAIIDGDPGKLIDAGLIAAIVLINTWLAFAQEAKAEKAIDALKKSMQPYAKVLRGGTVIRVKTYELVVGDIVLLEAGDKVPADLRLMEAASLMIEEASLTGESVPSEKNIGIIECTGNVALGDQKNMAFMSGIVTYGRGKGIVVATGMDTQLGLIADHLNKQEVPQTPLTKRLHKTSTLIMYVVLVIVAGVFISRAAMGHNIVYSIMLSIAIAVCVIPESLPACVTVTMSLGVQRMSKKKAIVRNLPAVETLGSTEIICSDKTGTLTLNKMTVQNFFLKKGEKDKECIFEVDATDTDKIDELNKNLNFKMLARCMLLCNDTKTRIEGCSLETIGDPTETALVHFAHKFNLGKEYADAKWPRVCELPFDSERKLMSTLNDKGEKGQILYTKGALDNLLPRCTKILDEGKVREITDADIKQINKVASSFAREALRVLGYAYRPVERERTRLQPSDEEGMIFIGFSGMIDPPREEVYESIKTCKSAGIMTVMITGDHKDTAFAIAKQIGIAESEDEVVTGAELDNMSDEDLIARIMCIKVYARVNPEHKVRVVKAFKSLDKVVAMTGDGVNDAASIKAADIGIGMGITGTDVTKGVSDVILTDDNFATIVSAVHEGRRVYDNILKILVYLLALHLAEVILITGILVVFNLPFFNPLLILWINVITATAPAMALGNIPASRDIMKQRPAQKGILFRGRTGEQILVYAFFQVGLVLTAYLTAMYAFGFDPVVAITMSYVVLGVVESVHVYSLYSSRASMFRENPFKDMVLNLSVIFSAILVVVSVVVPFAGFQNALGIAPLNGIQWLVALACGFAVLPLAEIYKEIRRRVDIRATLKESNKTVVCTKGRTAKSGEVTQATST